MTTQQTALLAEPGDGPEVARSMADLVEAQAAASEEQRTLSEPLVEALWQSGLMQFMNPAEAGGREPAFAEMIDTWLEMATLDGSFGWIGIANMPSAAAAAAYLPADGFAELFDGDAPVTVGGQFFPNGQGAVVDGGVRLTGAWNFGSGTGHSQYIAAGFIPMIDGEIEWADAEMPRLRVAIVPREEVDFRDGWFVQGLKGTGSYDYALDDVFVPEGRTFDLFADRPQRGSAPTFSMGLMAITAAGHAAWALGVARSMLDDVGVLASEKVRMGDMASLANREGFQRSYAHHQAAWQAARLLVHDAFGAAESAIAAGEDLSVTLRADMRNAAVFATDVAREAGEWAHLAAGTSAIREGTRLERAFRDLYTGTQHAFINEKVAISAAKVWLGLNDSGRGL